MHFEKCPDKGPRIPQVDVNNLLGSEEKFCRRVTFEFNLKECGGDHQARKSISYERNRTCRGKKSRIMCSESGKHLGVPELRLEVGLWDVVGGGLQEMGMLKKTQAKL